MALFWKKIFLKAWRFDVRTIILFIKHSFLFLFFLSMQLNLWNPFKIHSSQTLFISNILLWIKINVYVKSKYRKSNICIVWNNKVYTAWYKDYLLHLRPHHFVCSSFLYSCPLYNSLLYVSKFLLKSINNNFNTLHFYYFIKQSNS